MAKPAPMPTLRAVLWKAQRGRCWICQGPMLNDGSNDPSQASIDHLWPKARFGELGDVGVTMLACRECNTRRGSPAPTDDEIRALVSVWRNVDRRWLANQVKATEVELNKLSVKAQRAALLKMLVAA